MSRLVALDVSVTGSTHSMVPVGFLRMMSVICAVGVMSLTLTLMITFEPIF